jgi:hypothetical protein
LQTSDTALRRNAHQHIESDDDVILDSRLAELVEVLVDFGPFATLVTLENGEESALFRHGSPPRAEMSHSTVKTTALPVIRSSTELNERGVEPWGVFFVIVPPNHPRQMGCMPSMKLKVHCAHLGWFTNFGVDVA